VPIGGPRQAWSYSHRQAGDTSAQAANAWLRAVWSVMVVSLSGRRVLRTRNAAGRLVWSAAARCASHVWIASSVNHTVTLPRSLNEAS
jgi:hypothetical protein